MIVQTPARVDDSPALVIILDITFRYLECNERPVRVFVQACVSLWPRHGQDLITSL